MMLHVRDCPGTTASFDVCPFPWCRKVKHLLYHLVSCSDSLVCPICSNVHLNRNMRQLKGLNYYRGEIFQASLISKNKLKAEAEAADKQNVENNTNGKPHRPPSVTEVDYSIVPPAEGRDTPTNSLESSSGAESMKHFVLAAIKVEDDCGTEPHEGDTIRDPTDVSTASLSHKDDITAPVNMNNAAVVPVTLDSSVAGAKSVETLVDSVNHSERPLVDAITEDFNTVSPDGTKG
jgi:TAZ zinc finger